jgi:MoaA/NifB/PqqE/SkfB family radical SAM enzyme
MIVVWRINTHCNMGCGFCAYDRRLRIPRTSMHPDVVRDFARTLAEYQRLADDPTLLSFLGGEPFLWRPLEEVVRFVKAECHLRVSATTNGSTLPNTHTQKLIAEAFDELTVSLDGLPRFHDLVRLAPGAFQRIKEGIDRIRSIGRTSPTPLKLRLNAVLMHDNVEQFAALCEAVSTWPIDEITFNQLGGNDRPEFHAQHKLTSEDVERLSVMLPILRAQLASRGIRLMGGDHYVLRMMASANDERIAIDDCRPGRTFLFIDERGFLAPCSFTAASHGIDVRSITSVEAFMSAADHYPLALRNRRATACDDCPSTQIFAKYAA